MRLSIIEFHFEELSMSGVMASLDQRTHLAGHNRLELLMFRLDGAQYYGI